MAAIAAPELRVYFVWQPVLGRDALADAGAHAAAETDVRASHFWDDGVLLGQAYAPMFGTGAPEEGWSSPLGVKPVAWDAAFLFPRGVKWGVAPPRPAYFMFPDATAGMPAFDAKRFGDEVRAALASSAPPPLPSAASLSTKPAPSPAPASPPAFSPLAPASARTPVPASEPSPAAL